MERIVTAVLEFAESRAKRHIPMTMEDWTKRIDAYLASDERPLWADPNNRYRPLRPKPRAGGRDTLAVSKHRMGGVSMEWKEVRLGEIAQIQTGPFGSQLHQSDYIPCIMPTNIGSQLNFDTYGIAHVSELDAARLSRHQVQEGDIVYARRGDIEKCAYVKPSQIGWLCGTGCLNVDL